MDKIHYKNFGPKDDGTILGPDSLNERLNHWLVSQTGVKVISLSFTQHANCTQIVLHCWYVVTPGGAH